MPTLSVLQVQRRDIINFLNFINSQDILEKDTITPEKLMEFLSVKRMYIRV